MNRLKFSFNSRWASLATVSNTIDDFPEPETPVKIVILRLGMRSETFFKLFSLAPRTSMYSWGMNSLLIGSLVPFHRLLQDPLDLGFLGFDIPQACEMLQSPVHIIPVSNHFRLRLFPRAGVI